MIESIEIIRLFSVFVLLFLFYLIFTKSKDNKTIKEDNENEPQTIDFDNSNIGIDFKLTFEPIKNLSGDNLKAIKIINTVRFGSVQIEIFKGSSFSDDPLKHWIEIKEYKRITNKSKEDEREPIILSEMDTNDLIILLTFINKL
jgi:hypothetical protein